MTILIDQSVTSYAILSNEDGKHTMVLTTEDYERACKIAGKLVAIFGDVYLPIFERTLDELNNAKRKSDLKSAAIAYAFE